jgi:DNA-binding CsgD family transcriptional regulator/sugar-specific transcriptional regulator TrmB
MLDTPGSGVSDLATRLGWTVGRVHDALDELSRLSLLRPSHDSPGRWLAISPEVGLSALLARQEADIAERQSRIAASRHAVAAIVEDYAASRPATEQWEVEKLNGVDEVRNCIEKMVQQCEKEIISFVPQGALDESNVKASRPLDLACAQRGVRTRDIYLESVRNHPPTTAYLRWLAEHDVQIRTAATLPLRMTVFDGRYALMPIDPQNTSQGAVLTRSPGTITALSALFELTWRTAVPLGEERPRDESGLTPQEREVLNLLVQGHTDDVVARKLAISVRTGRRITADLMERLGARSRFQAGARTVRRGWLDDV